ncbi:hypothetical protein [Ralstonia condita]|nr:hypothetical protein [Ralstonia sp. LMG 7141]
MAIELKNGMSAIFPVIKERPTWKWYRTEATRETAEYAWVAEPGFILMNSGKKLFQGNGMAFIAFIGAMDLRNITPGSGNLEDLISSAEKIAYLTGSDKSRLHENLDFVRRSRVNAKLLNNDAIMLATVNKASTEAAKKSNPTHMKMRAILPYAGESYECIVEIKKINNSVKMINE